MWGIDSYWSTENGENGAIEKQWNSTSYLTQWQVVQIDDSKDVMSCIRINFLINFVSQIGSQNAKSLTCNNKLLINTKLLSHNKLLISNKLLIKGKFIINKKLPINKKFLVNKKSRI